MEFTNSGPPANMPQPVHVKVTNAARAQAVFTAFLNLPSSYATGASADTDCGADRGIGFNFVFRDVAGATVATATIDPGGCYPASVRGASGGVKEGTALETPSFWQTLDGALNVTSAQLDIWSTPATFLNDGGT
jgi:hypothetical protein